MKPSILQLLPALALLVFAGAVSVSAAELVGAAAADATPPPVSSKVPSWEEINARWGARPTNETWEAATKGDAWAQHYLGRYFHLGMGGITNWTEGVKWYRLAVAQGFANSQNNLAGAFQAGRGVPQDVQEAERLFRLAAAQGMTMAQRNLASLLLAPERLTTARQTEARKFLEQSAQAGDADSMVALAQYLQWPPGGGVIETEKIIYWLEKAYLKGRTDMACEIGWAHVDYGKKDYETAKDWFQQGVDRGDASCELSFGWLYLKGGGVEQDLEQALKWIRKAVDKNYPPAIRDLGRLYAHDEMPLTLPLNLKEAERLYRLAAEKDDADAIRRMAALFVDHRIPDPRKEAATWVRKAIPVTRQLFPLRWLAELILRGDAQPNGPEEEPLFLYARLAGGGHEEAFVILEQWYTQGKGVPKDLLVAGHYARRLLPYKVQLTPKMIGEIPAHVTNYLHSVESKDVALPMDIANRYLEGHGTYQSDFEAYIWFAHAARNGDAAAEAARDKVKARLSAVELKRAGFRLFQMSANARFPW